MDQILNVLRVSAIDKAHTPPQMVLDCKPDLGGLNHVIGPNCPTPCDRVSVAVYVCSVQCKILASVFMLS